MQSWVTLLWCILIALSLTKGHDDQPNDSLRTAIDALSRRQRDLAASGPNYYVGGGLAQYRYSDRDVVPRDDLAFLGTPRDFAGDGQPENIGYGYQKTIASSPGVYPPQAPLRGEQPHSVTNKELKNFLLGYLDDEVRGGPEDGDDVEDDDEAYYRHGGRIPPKRSPFRERTGKQRTIRKRDDELRDFVPTAFRERVHDRLVDDAEERKVRILTEELARKMEEEEEDNEEERRERERGRMDAGNTEEEYLNILRSVWNKYRKNNPYMNDIEDISEGDIGEIMDYLEDNGVYDEGIKEEARKRQDDGGYDFLTHDVAMGGWGVGGHQFRKRWNQRLDGDENQKGNFLYSLKFVSPAANPEAIESLKDEEGLDLPDERDEDILRISPGPNRKEHDTWFPVFERDEAPEGILVNPNEEDYQRLVLAKQNDHSPGLSRKRFASLAQPNYGVREIFPAPQVFPTPGKKYFYDTAVLKKRFPVTKRSSGFYTSPPLLHHKSFAFVDNSETRRKKDVVTTDPKVACELNQIFSSPTVSDLLHSETHLKETAHGNESSEKGVIDTEHVATTHPPVASNSTASSKVREEGNITNHDDPRHESGSAKKTTAEQPVTASRTEATLDIKKKSINWSDYFGIDRRRKKTGPVGSGNHSGTSNDHPIDDEWLFNQYYKAYAMSTNPNKKRASMQSHEHMHSKKAALWQPFDTRVFDPRNAQHESSKKDSRSESTDQSEKTRIDNMDGKLRNFEDMIVNEALKYTGAHEGITDAKEIQDVKDKVMANLATAYSLEKMRQALRDFKSSLLAQKMSRYNPENTHVSSGDEKKKRVAVKKDKAEEKHDKDEKKRGDGRTEDSNEDVGEFLQGPVVVQPFSETDMDRHVLYNEGEKECPVLEGILNTCQSAENLVGDHGQLFLPLCSLHQICYLCGPELGAPSPAACDIMFVTEADLMCLGNTDCQRVAQKSIALLRRSQQREVQGQCWRSPCIANHFLHTPLPVPIPAYSSR